MGRFVLGVGAGYQDADFDRFGVRRRDRVSLMEDGLDLLRRAWAGSEVDGAHIRPALGSVPPPPVWLGAWSRAGVERAASAADGWIADPIRTISQVASMAQLYRASAAGKGHVVVMREGWVDVTDRDARSTYGPVVEPIYRYYLEHNAFPGEEDLSPADLTLTGALGDRVVVGSAETVANRLVELVARTGAQSVILALRHPGGPTHDRVLDAIRLLGAEVAPAVNKELA